MTSRRQYSAPDQLLIQADRLLRTLAGKSAYSERPSPATDKQSTALDAGETKHIAGLMRINHTGEVCAQALYQGQALTARLTEVKEKMQEAADEETDHLAWCQQRLNELNSHPSLLNPLFYAASFGLGALAGAAGDKWSLGFVAETEHQVCRHLEKHLQQVPDSDAKTRAVLEQMREDEAKHAVTAKDAGAAELPAPVKASMRLASKAMTKTTYYI